MKTAALVVICTLMLAVGQLCWKTGLQEHGFSLSGNGLRLLAGSWLIWAGFALFGIATLVWFAVLSKSPLSLVYPLMSLSYLFGLVMARYLLGESISLVRWAGVGLICLGVALVTR